MTSTGRAPVGVRPVAATAAVMLVTAVGAHAAGGGTLPPADHLAAVAAILAVVGVATTRLAGRRWVVLGLVAAGQYVAHGLLAATSLGPARPHPAHGHAPVGTGGMGGTGGTGDGTVWIDARMVVLHLVAAVAVGLLLAQGDRLLTSVVAALRPSWLAPRHRGGRPLRAREVRVPVTRAPVVAPPAIVCVRRRPRRGPPCRLGAAPPRLA